MAIPFEQRRGAGKSRISVSRPKDATANRVAVARKMITVLVAMMMGALAHGWELRSKRGRCCVNRLEEQHYPGEGVRDGGEECRVREKKSGHFRLQEVGWTITIKDGIVYKIVKMRCATFMTGHVKVTDSKAKGVIQMRRRSRHDVFWFSFDFTDVLIASFCFQPLCELFPQLIDSLSDLSSKSLKSAPYFHRQQHK